LVGVRFLKTPHANPHANQSWLGIGWRAAPYKGRRRANQSADRAAAVQRWDSENNGAHQKVEGEGGCPRDDDVPGR
jgi:hypothetical protein